MHITSIKKIFSIVIIIISIVTLTACDELKIVLDTRINDDGSADRKISYIFTPSDAMQLQYVTKNLPDILCKGFVLPAGADWNIQTFIKDNSFYYVASRKFTSINNLVSDYHKRSTFYGASKNYISFSKTKNRCGDNFNYLEVFKDSSDIRKFIQKFADYFSLNREKFARRLYSITSKYISTFQYSDSMQIIDIFAQKALGLREIVNRFSIIGPNETDIINREFRAIDSEIRIGDFIDFLGPNNKNNQPDTKLLKLFHLDRVNLSTPEKQKFSKELQDFVREEFTKVAQETNVDPLGAYFTSLDMLNKYYFEYNLTMPGIITESNGQRIDENTIQWLFVPEDFFNHDYVIIAKSTIPPAE